MEKRYQVFISSTFSDLEEERAQVQKMLMQLNCIPAGMELFPAIDEEQLEFIKKVIDDSDYYVLIVGGRYGSVAKDGLSYTEKEYDYAVEKGMKVIALLHQNPKRLSLEKSEQDTRARKSLEKFRKKILKGRLVLFWDEANELPGKLAQSLPVTIKSYPAVGWVRATSVPSSDLYKEINELRKENDALKLKLQNHNDFAHTHNIEGLDDHISIIGTQHDYVGDITSKNNADSTWGELFYFIAPVLHGGLSEEIVIKAVEKFFYKKVGRSPNSSYKFQFPTLQQLRVQFRALDLITLTPTAKDTQWGLTPQGEKLLLINKAKKKM